MSKQVWDRQPGETTVAYAAFCVYRDMGPERSQEAVAQKLGKSRQLLSRWSTKWRWCHRADQYDAYLQQLAQREIERSVTAAAQQHEVIARELLAAAAVATKQLAARLRKSRSRASIAQVTALAVEAIKLHRLLIGQPTARHEVNEIAESARAKLADRLARLAGQLGETSHSVRSDGQ